MSALEQAAAKMFGVGFGGMRVPDEMRRLIGRGVGGAILFRRNFENGEQFADLCAELKRCAERPFFTGIDHEGGRVVRLGLPFTAVPSMRTVGRDEAPETARHMAEFIGRELRAANIDMNFAPVLDVDTNSGNPVIGDRSFGADPQRVAEMGAAWIGGLQSAGIAACGKHFPGHGDTTQDSHLDLPRLRHSLARLEEIELAPFAAAIRAGVAAIMTAHVVFEAIDPAVPATMSRAVLTGLLRERLGFQGVIISDDLEMKAIANHFALREVITRGVHAGVDLFLICHTPELQNAAIDVVIERVERGDISREQIDAAGRRIDLLFSKYVQPAQPGTLSERLGRHAGPGMPGPVSGKNIRADPTSRD